MIFFIIVPVVLAFDLLTLSATGVIFAINTTSLGGW